MSSLAPGWLRNTIRMRGTAATIFANFDRTVTAPPGQNVSGLAVQRESRVCRPGAILLPNLDIDQTGARTRFGARSLDANNIVVDGGDDAAEVTYFYVAEANPLPAALASRIDLQIAGADCDRVRAWRVPAATRLADGGDATFGLGDRALAFPSFNVIGHWLKSAPAWRQHFAIEALTLAGDPRAPAPGGASPLPPGRRHDRPRGDRGSESSVTIQLRHATQGMYAARAPGDVWVTVEHYDWNDHLLADLTDRVLFTIAPWMMTWNTLNCERVYVVYRNPNNARGHNHPLVWDLQRACSAAGLTNGAPYTPSADSTLPITPNVRGDIVNGNEIPFYVIDGALVGNDKWPQDEMEIGYCWAPHKWMHVVLHCPRRRANRELGIFVEDHLPHAGLGLFNGVITTAMGGAPTQNFGGNLEVSPPVLNTTPAIDADNAGLAVRAHRAAPFGKILWGDGDATNARRCEDPYRDFLRAQVVQPIVPIDTSWLTVAHVDEILTFVRAGGVRANGDHTFKMLYADFDAADILYQEAVTQHNHATLHAGKYRRNAYAEEFVNDVLLGGDFTASRLTQTNRLTPIEARLRAGLDIAAADVIPVPVFFHEETFFGQPTSCAHTPGMMNLLVVNDHLMIPRPFGPRLPPGLAAVAVTNALNQIFTARGVAVPAAVIPAAGLYFWAAPDVTLDEIAAYFVDPYDIQHPFTPRRAIIDSITNGIPVPWQYQVAHTTMRNAILNDVLNTGAATPINTACPGGTFDRWMRIWIPDGRVDITEAYMASVLAGTGNTLHFIDDFEPYHADYGEVHCGTNARRTPPELNAAFTARWWDNSVYDTGYNTTY